jgi:hypothetical protein
MSVINLTNEFEIRTLLNQSKRLIQEYGYENQIRVTLEVDPEAELGSSIVLVDIATNEKLKVSATKLKRYYERKDNQYLSNLSSADAEA